MVGTLLIPKNQDVVTLRILNNCFISNNCFILKVEHIQLVIIVIEFSFKSILMIY